MTEKNADGWKHTVENPYVPDRLLNQLDRADLRIANALEYIAAQMGEINVKLGALLTETRRQNMKSGRACPTEMKVVPQLNSVSSRKSPACDRGFVCDRFQRPC
ncbi:MAG: hypothetical protein WBX25_37055 [Rhodomicrobium sp.]